MGPAGELEQISSDPQTTERELAEGRSRLDAALNAGEVGTFVWDVVKNNCIGGLTDPLVE